MGPNGTGFARAISGPKKVSIFRAHPSNAPRNDVAPLKIITYRAIKTTGTLVVLCTPVLLCVVVCKRGGEVSLQLCCVSRYSFHGSMVECPHPVTGGACSIVHRNINKLVLFSIFRPQ